MWDVERGERRLEVECGGGHRAWDFLGQQRGQGEDYRFLFIKAREVVMVTGGQKSGQDIVKVRHWKVYGCHCDRWSTVRPRHYQGKMLESLRSVSYTHLTLPTKVNV